DDSDAGIGQTPNMVEQLATALGRQARRHLVETKYARLHQQCSSQDQHLSLDSGQDACQAPFSGPEYRAPIERRAEHVVAAAVETAADLEVLPHGQTEEELTPLRDISEPGP